MWKNDREEKVGGGTLVAIVAVLILAFAFLVWGFGGWDPRGKQSWTERYARINHTQSGSASRWQPLRNRNGALMLSGYETLSVNLTHCGSGCSRGYG
jgi:hypothetical protein